MKNIRVYIIIFIVSFFISTGCDDGFDELNVSKTGITQLDPITLLNSAIMASSIDGTLLEGAFIQQVVTPFGGVLTGGNFNQVNVTLTNRNWNTVYNTIMKLTVDVINTVKEDPDRANLYHMTRIIKAYGAMVATDTYGDIPYSSAAKGFIDGTTSPVYDSQKSIYLDILQELQAASAGLNTGGTIETTDLLYGGDVTKWKRLGNSLLLRAAMRAYDQEPSTAGSAISAAVTGGLMQSNDDNFVIRHDFTFRNPAGGLFTGGESANFYMTANFIDHLKNTNDPRLASMAVRYIGAASGTDQIDANASIDPADQFGLPMGLDDGAALTWAQDNGFAHFYALSQVDRTRMGAVDAPAYMVTYAQTQLLLAEAIQRGIVAGDANAEYIKGIQANMAVVSTEYSNTTISQADIDTYVAANNLVSGTELDQINSEYWVSSFLIGPEAWANFRRSDLPALTPNPFPGQDISGDFVNRLPYPISEVSANPGNLTAAISSQGFSENDDMDSKVWWDNN